jgi:hypothetical protein
VDRVVRRHVAKLETAGWCQRMPAIRGDGMLVWLTTAGLDGVGLGELPALRAPGPFSPRTRHTVRVAWAAADIERAGHRWIPSREMALAPSRWVAQVANERGGHSRRLPDLVFWSAGDEELQVAVVVVQGQSNPRRERAALEGWRDSIAAGRYAQVRYLARPAAARHLRRVATEIGLTAPQFIAGENVMADELPVVPPMVEDVDKASLAVETAPVVASDLPRPSPAHVDPPRSRPQEPLETPEQAAEHQKLIDEVLGHEERARRRRWRRGAV